MGGAARRMTKGTKERKLRTRIGNILVVSCDIRDPRGSKGVKDLVYNNNTIEVKTEVEVIFVISV